MRKIGLKQGVWFNAASAVLAGAGAAVGTSSEQAIAQYAGWGGATLGMGLFLWGITFNGDHWWRTFSEVVRKHISWRFALRRNPKIELPNMTVQDLLERVAKMRGIDDDGSIEALRQYREVARDMSDQFSLHGVTMWGRVDGRPLARLDDELAKLGFGVGRYADGQIRCSLICRNADDVQVWVDHLHVRKAQVDGIWPYK